jgi:small-conductance mechanosensitive channel
VSHSVTAWPRRWIRSPGRSAALLALLLAAPVLAQPAPPPEPEVAPEPIPVSSIAVEAAGLVGRLRSLEDQLAVPAEQEQIGAELPELDGELQQRVDRLTVRLETGTHRSEIEGLLLGWSSIDETLARWDAQLARRLALLEEIQSDLAQRSEIWSATAESAAEQQAPPEIRSEIRAAQQSLSDARGRVRASRDQALGLQNRVVGLHEQVREQSEALAQAREQIFARLLERGAPPLWKVHPDESEVAADRFASSLDDLRAAFAAYPANHEARIWLHLLGTAALIWVSVRARRSAVRMEAEGVAPFAEALRHPWAAGLLLGLSAGAFVHGNAPPALRFAIGLGLLAPWALVVRGLLPQTLRRPLLGLLVLVLLEFSRRLLVDFAGISRLLLVLETSAAFLGVLWLRRPARLSKVPQPDSPFWMNALALWLQVVAILSGIATAGAVFGWVNLADVLAVSVVHGTFTGSIVYAGALAIEAIAQSMSFAGRLSRVRLIAYNRPAFLRIVGRATRTLAVAVWIAATLSALGLWDATHRGLGRLLGTPVGYGNIEVTLGGLGAFGVAVWLSFLLSRFLAAVLESEVFSRVVLPRGVPFALSTIGRYAVLVVGFALAVAALGFEVGNLALVLSALGVGIGFGLQNVVNNFISGLILLFERPIKAGDMVSIDTLTGEITRIGMRASILRTFDGADVIIPNGDLLSGRLTNWTLADRLRRVSLPVGVAYGTPAPRVLELLQRVGAAHPDVLPKPPPVALFQGFGDSSLDFELRVWTESADALTLVRTALAVAVQAALEEADIEVPFPQRDLHVKSLPAAGTGVDPK